MRVSTMPARALAATSRLVVYVLVGATMTAAFPSQAMADDHIEITREVLLEPGTAVKPRVITQTREGGYVIAGTKSRAWATRVDSAGNVQWRHEANVSERGGGEYAGAAVLPDDSVILCGSQHVPEQAKGKISGLLTRIDKAGQVVDERLLEPNDGQFHGLTHLNACVAIGEEVLVFGDTYVRESNAMSGWIVVLDASGNVKREHLSSVAARESKHVRVLPNGDAVFTTEVLPIKPGVLRSTRAVRVGSSGAVKAQSAVVPSAVIQAVPTYSDSEIRLVPASPNQAKKIITLNEQLDVIGQVGEAPEFIISRRAYYLPDRSLVLFGGKGYHGNSFSASIAWISPDLSEKSAVLIDPPLASDAIVDAVPTGVSGEFATVRPIWPMTEAGHTEARLGAVLAFVRIK